MFRNIVVNPHYTDNIAVSIPQRHFGRTQPDQGAFQGGLGLVLTRPGQQFIFVDTPGFQTKHKNALNRIMNRGVTQALKDVDVILLVIEAGRYTEDDKRILAMIPEDRVRPR